MAPLCLIENKRAFLGEPREFKSCSQMNNPKYHNRRGKLAPDPEMWAALSRVADDGAGLNEILDDFYSRVYADARLAHFFEGVTKQRAIEKQHSFLRSIFTGERVYFGDRPRNAHHWMVISNELFDYREALMEDCLRRWGLAEHLIKRWREVEETFRRAIVKDKPWPKKINGVELPLEGYDTLTLEFTSLCDGCEGEMNIGDTVTYHVRTGKTWCATCAESLESEDLAAEQKPEQISESVSEPAEIGSRASAG